MTKTKSTHAFILHGNAPLLVRFNGGSAHIVGSRTTDIASKTTKKNGGTLYTEAHILSVSITIECVVFWYLMTFLYT